MKILCGQIWNLDGRLNYCGGRSTRALITTVTLHFELENGRQLAAYTAALVKGDPPHDVITYWKLESAPIAQRYQRQQRLRKGTLLLGHRNNAFEKEMISVNSPESHV